MDGWFASRAPLPVICDLTTVAWSLMPSHGWVLGIPRTGGPTRGWVVAPTCTVTPWSSPPSTTDPRSVTLVEDVGVSKAPPDRVVDLIIEWLEAEDDSPFSETWLDGLLEWGFVWNAGDPRPDAVAMVGTSAACCTR